MALYSNKTEKFQIVGYLATHDQLLLRSFKSQAGASVPKDLIQASRYYLIMAQLYKSLYQAYDNYRII